LVRSKNWYRNNVLRNLCNKVREIAKPTRVDLNVRNFLRSNVLKFRTTVSVIKFRKTKNILNGSSVYPKDASYFCKQNEQSNEIAYE
jgi:hypothetical protein